MKIAIDAFGGDYAPTEIIKGVVDAVNADALNEKDIRIEVEEKPEQAKVNNRQFARVG